jgi:hypothetical protein
MLCMRVFDQGLHTWAITPVAAGFEGVESADTTFTRPLRKISNQLITCATYRGMQTEINETDIYCYLVIC